MTQARPGASPRRRAKRVSPLESGDVAHQQTDNSPEGGDMDEREDAPAAEDRVDEVPDAAAPGMAHPAEPPRRSVIIGGGRTRAKAVRQAVLPSEPAGTQVLGSGPAEPVGRKDPTVTSAPVDLSALPALAYGSRLRQCQAALSVLAVDALLVTKLQNIRYLSGFSGSNALLLVGPAGAILVTDARYDEQASQQLSEAGLLTSTGGSVELVINADPASVLGPAASAVRRLALEAASVTWAAQRRYAETWFPYAELVPTTEVVETQRLVKEQGEVARIEVAAGIVDAALREVIGRLSDGPTELEFAAELEAAMKRRGSSAPAFETIIASGPNAARPHARPGNRRIERGDLVVVDVGGLCDGYASDMTRTVCVGEPSVEQRRLYAVVCDAQQAAVERVGDGVVCKDVDFAARQRIEDAGWGPQFPHGVGHGVGLEIHEAPHVGRVSESILATGWVVTVEPGVYLPGVGGVRTEDTVLVTDDGCRRLTGFPKSLTI